VKFEKLFMRRSRRWASGHDDVGWPEPSGYARLEVCEEGKESRSVVDLLKEIEVERELSCGVLVR
jgi:hypothetical protein